jgi:tetratricopeptide (TPR) repeat protein
VPLRKFDRSIPQELETILLKCLEKEPARRYPTAQVLADDLERYLENKPITAHPPTLVERAAKWASRHSLAVSVTLLIAVVCTVVLGASTIWVVNERNAVRAAEHERGQQAYRARTNLESAVETVSKLLTTVSEQTLFATPGGTPIRRRLLEDAGLQLESLCSGQDDPDLLLRTSAVFRQIGTLYAHFGDMEQSLTPLSRAAELLSASIAASPGRQVTLEHHLEMASIGLSLAHSNWYCGRYDEAEKQIQDAITSTQAVSDDRATFRLRLLAIPLLRQRGQIRISQRRFDVSAADFQDALRHLRECHDEVRSDDQKRWSYHVQECGLLNDLGFARMLAGDRIRAIETFRQTSAIAADVDLRKSGLSKDDGEPKVDYKADSVGLPLPLARQLHWLDAQACCQLGQLYSDEGDVADARSAYERAVNLLDPLAAEFPDVFWTRSQLVEAIIGSALGSASDESELLLARAVEIWESLPDGATRFIDASIAWQIVTSGRTGDFAGASVKFAQRAVDSQPESRTWNTLGAALYRSRRFVDAEIALTKSMELDLENRKFAYNVLLLAMTHWQLGDQEKARSWYDKAVAWMDENAKLVNEEVRRFQAEAANLLASGTRG